MSYAVIVTYGNSKNTVYSYHKKRQDAEKLKRLAIERKYFDARVEEIEDAIPSQHKTNRVDAKTRSHVPKSQYKSKRNHQTKHFRQESR